MKRKNKGQIFGLPFWLILVVAIVIFIILVRMGIIQINL